MSFYNQKKVLVTGGTGMIGRPLVQNLINLGARVTVVSLDDPSCALPDCQFQQIDLREFQACLKVCKDKDIVFHLAGVKGSPQMAMEKPASFFVPTMTFNLNMMEAARRSNVGWFLYTSSIGVYHPAERFYEDDVWQTFPSVHDRFAGWAKRMGELQAEAYQIEHGWNRVSIVRPANVYGPFDNFDPRNGMVIPSLIHRAINRENPLSVWGDGTPRRDFIHANDVAEGMLLTVEKGITQPLNLGSGEAVSIKIVAELICKHTPGNPKINWDVSKAKGDDIRLMDIKRATSYGFKPKIDIETGIQQTIEWYIANKHIHNKRYNAFLESS